MNLFVQRSGLSLEKLTSRVKRKTELTNRCIIKCTRIVQLKQVWKADKGKVFSPSPPPV